MHVAFCQFSNHPHHSSLEADAMTFLVILISTCTGQFSGGVSVIGVLYFGTREIIRLLFFLPLVLRFKIHLNIYGESSRFFYVLLLHLDITRCNLRIL